MNARTRYVLGALAGVAYAVASCLLMIRMPDSPLALAAVLGPMAGAAIVGLYLGGRRVLAVVLAAGTLALVEHAMNGGRVTPQALYLAQHAGVHFGLGLWFGSTLLAGRTPLITGLARQLHREMPPALVHYTRQVTLAWVVYFMAMAAASLLLFVAAPFSVWSLFANLLTPLALVAMFVGEYLLRYRLHPEFERVSVRAAIAAYRHRP
jgi:uncharacterized membrane protein